MSLFEMLKVNLIHPIGRVMAKSYIITQFARYVVRVYDNDCNPDMEKNGERALQRVVAGLCDADSVFVDVGANHGDWSEALIQDGYTGHLVAVDPLRRNLEIVRKKLSDLNFSNFELCECALSDKNEKLQFFVNQDPELSGHDSLFDMRSIGYEESVDRIEVQSKTLEKLVDELDIKKINFLKIDVEGNELSVLRGAKSLLSQGAIDFIQFEFGHASRAGRIYLHDVVNFIREFEYELFVIKPSGVMPLDFSPFTENRYSFINFLLAKNDVANKLDDYILENRALVGQ